MQTTLIIDITLCGCWNDILNCSILRTNSSQLATVSLKDINASPISNGGLVLCKILKPKIPQLKSSNYHLQQLFNASIYNMYIILYTSYM